MLSSPAELIGRHPKTARKEAASAGRSTDYQFSLAEVRLPVEGKGQGKAIPAAKLTLDKDGGLEIENYQAQPVRLNEITVAVPKEKK